MIRWFTGHPTAGNLLLLLILAAGAFAAPGLLRETFPDFRAVEAEITVPYRGAAAEDVGGRDLRTALGRGAGCRGARDTHLHRADRPRPRRGDHGAGQ